MNLPTLPPPPCAPCTLETFSTWAQEVIDLLQPHSYQPAVANGRRVRLIIQDEGTRTLGVWSPRDHAIRIHDDYALACCRRGTADLVDTLLHECAHFLAPLGAKHGPQWRRCAELLGCTPRATAPAEREYRNPSAMPLTPAQITGAEPLPGNDAETPTTRNGQNVPSFDARAPYHQLAGWVAASIPHGALYRQDDKFVTIHIEDNGNIKTVPMTKLRLPTWLPEQQFCTFHGGKRKGALPDEPPPVTSISPAQAELIMASDVFRERMPELAGISNVRLPIITTTTKGPVRVHKEDGTTVERTLPIYNFEPTAEGYDKRSKIYTHATVKQNFEKYLTLEKARRFIVRAFSEAALDGGFEGENALHPLQSRSLGAVVTAMLGQFLHHCIDSFPLVLVVANQPGTGKSFLVETLLAPMHEQVGAINFLEDDKEFRQTLNAMLFDGSRYCWLDDVRTLKSNALNRFITSTRIKDRLLHTQITFNKENRMQFFATGNTLKVTPDIARRSLPIDLFFAADASQRTFQGIINEEIIRQPGIRSSFLSCLWSFTKHWQNAGCPRYIEKAPGGSFARYVTLAANIAIHAGFANPYGPRLVDLDSGDAVGKALQEVLIVMADSITPAYGQPHRGASKKFRVGDLEDFATRMHKIEIIVPYGNNKRDNLGQAMRSMKGREFTDNRGRRFSVGSSRDSASSLYPFTILSEPTRELSDAAAATLTEALGQETDPDPEF
ncbi:MAG: hypothetical protein IJO38_06020 [Akkermansia sp.]|nr:hypothetical protein [Akkermansia sp.]